MKYINAEIWIIFYSFVVVWIKLYTRVLEAAIWHIANIFKAQIMNNNKHYVNNYHNLMFSLFQFIFSLPICLMIIWSCHSFWYDESETSLPTHQKDNFLSDLLLWIQQVFCSIFFIEGALFLIIFMFIK